MRFGMRFLVRWSLIAILGLAIITFVIALMAGGQPPLWLLMAYLVLFSIGEALWQPRFLQYAAELAPEGQTGVALEIAADPGDGSWERPDEEIVDECTTSDISRVIESIKAYEADFEAFALRHERYAVLGLAIQDPRDLYQIASHYLDDIPELQVELSRALHNNLYQIDIFLSEADTLIAKDKFRVNMCSHDAYGIDTVRNPLWSVFWKMDKHEMMVKEFKRLGFKTGDTIGIEIDSDDKPIVYRL